MTRNDAKGREGRESAKRERVQVMVDDGVNAVELWAGALDVLRGQMTLTTFQTTFGGSQAGLFDGETLDVALVSQSACEWARERLGAVVARAVGSVAGSPVVVRFSTTSGGKAASPIDGIGTGELVTGEREVRDQRRVGWYRVDNVVLDDYVPLMGIKSFAVYSLYCRMSGRDGLSWPGYSRVCATLRIGRTTLSQCNHELEVLGLIEVERGGRQRSNRYYLLEPETLTDEVLRKIRVRAIAADLPALVGGIDSVLEGSPVQDYPSPERGLPQSSTGTTLVLNGDYPSPERGLEQDILNKTQEEDSGRKPPSVPPERGDDLDSGNGRSDNELTDWLVELGIARSVALKLVVAYEHDLIVAWVEYTMEQENIKKPAAFLVHKLRQGGWP